MKKTDLTPLERARADLVSKTAAIKALEVEMDAIRAAIRYMEELYENSNADLIEDNVIVGAEQPQTKEYAATEFCTKYVDAHGPATGAELHHAFLEAGHTLTGKDRNAQMVTLAGYLNRTKALRHYKDYGRWWFADRPYPRRGFFG